jgi:hypothetical protein
MTRLFDCFIPFSARDTFLMAPLFSLVSLQLLYLEFLPGLATLVKHLSLQWERFCRSWSWFRVRGWETGGRVTTWSSDFTILKLGFLSNHHSSRGLPRLSLVHELNTHLWRSRRGRSCFWRLLVGDISLFLSLSSLLIVLFVLAMSQSLPELLTSSLLLIDRSPFPTNCIRTGWILGLDCSSPIGFPSSFPKPILYSPDICLCGFPQNSPRIDSESLNTTPSTNWSDLSSFSGAFSRCRGRAGGGLATQCGTLSLRR